MRTCSAGTRPPEAGILHPARKITSSISGSSARVGTATLQNEGKRGLSPFSHKPAPTSATVDFGVLPTPLIGGPSTKCLQSGAIGGPGDPCSYRLHHLTPEEVTIKQGGEVTFQIHRGGHGFAICAVSKDTTREELGQFLCAGEDPRNISS